MTSLPVSSPPWNCRIGPRLFATLLAYFLLVACSTLPDQPQPTAPLASRPLAANFTATGRIAARVTGDTKRGFSGGFTWAHRSGEDIVELLTPLGQIAARVTMTAAGALIDVADGRRTFTSDPEQFLSDALGVMLPIAALLNWLQAVPLPGVPYRAEVDTLGRPVTLSQNGWQIQYSAYGAETADANPARMQLVMGDVEARIIISEWSTQ